MPFQVVGQQPAMESQDRQRGIGVRGEAGQFSAVWFSTTDAAQRLGFPSYKAFWEWQRRANKAAALRGEAPVLVSVRVPGTRRLRFAKADLDRLFTVRKG